MRWFHIPFTKLLRFACLPVIVLALVLTLVHMQLSAATSMQISPQFVTRSGSELLLNGQKFRFAGPNIHWLGLDDSSEYLSQSHIDAAFSDAQHMDATVVRGQTLGMSVGCPNCLEPRLNQFNDQAFNTIDYSIKSAAAHNIRLIIPLVDWNITYEGGAHTFTSWRGISDQMQFYTNKTVIQDFEKYIFHLLTHVNPYTGLALKDDPTIMAWETGNELQSAPGSWTRTISSYLKSLAPNQLVIDGSMGINPNDFGISTIDMFSDHFYPRNTQQLLRDVAQAQQQRKAFLIGEWDWTNIPQYGWEASPHTSTPLATFLTAIETSQVSGDLYWQLYDSGHSGDDFSINYPGQNAAMQKMIQMLTTHAAKMSASR
jgi:mannan endo-1,4-beta-mannosidase